MLTLITILAIIRLMKDKVKKGLDFWAKYYPIILAFISFLYSVTLWFSGYKLEGIFVGIWV